jgi:excisionase family DNA binding protein
MVEQIFMRRKSAAEACAISLPVLDQLIRDGRIAVVRVGRAVLIPKQALEQLAGPNARARRAGAPREVR